MFPFYFDRHKGPNLASMPLFLFCVKCLHMLSPKLNGIGTVTSLCLISPRQMAKVSEKFSEEKGRKVAVVENRR